MLLHRILFLIEGAIAAQRYGDWSGPPEHQGGHAERLQNTSNLIGKCFNFPTSDFDYDNSINAYYPNDPTPLVARGGFAIDFALPSLDDNVYYLRDLIRTKPVVMVYGMLTCPAFQGLYLEDHKESHFSKYDQWALVDKYHKDFHFVNLYSVEPHPMAPDKNFDTGGHVEYAWSTFRQPRTYRDRGYFAQNLAEELHEKSILLVDNLGNEKLPELKENNIPEYNPVWCTYGPGSRMAFLIGQDGKLYNVQGWFHATTMAGAMEEHLILSSLHDLERKTASSRQLEALTVRREVAYAQMERKLRETLDILGARDAQYDPSPRSREILRAEARGNIEEYVSLYEHVKSSTLSDSIENTEFMEQELNVISSKTPSDGVVGGGTLIFAFGMVLSLSTAFTVYRRQRNGILRSSSVSYDSIDETNEDPQTGVY